MQNLAARAYAVCVGLFAPAPLLAQGLIIDHTPVGCVVAEKYPKMNACFAPASELARARVYFRAEEGPPNWYYVEMKSDAPCHTGILPKPKKELIGKKILYYVNAFDRKFAENRTVDNAPVVVRSESECKGMPVAAAVASASVAVFPGMPAGFAAGGIGTATAVAAVAGGAAVVGGGVALGTHGNNNTSATTSLVSSAPTTLPATTSTTTTSTTLVPFSAVFNIRLNGAPLAPDATTGFGPPGGTAQVQFDMCQSTGPFQLDFNVDVFGTTATAGCFSSITFTQTGYTVPFRAAQPSSTPLRALFSYIFLQNPVSLTAAAIPLRPFTLVGYRVRMRMQSRAPNNDPKAFRDILIVP